MPTLKIKANQFADCRVCLLAKATRSSHKGERERPIRKFHTIAIDILDPMADSAMDDNRYIVEFTCLFSGFTKVCAIITKDCVALEFAKYHKSLENEFSNDRVVHVRVDGAQEFVAGDF